MNRTYIDFDVDKEEWNKYLLKDGTTLSLKLVLINIMLEGMDKLGNPQFGFLMNNVMGVRLPDNWVKLPKEEDVEISESHDAWNEYKTKNGYLLKLKPNVSQITRTENYDPMGNPIYIIQSSPMVKVSKI